MQGTSCHIQIMLVIARRSAHASLASLQLHFHLLSPLADGKCNKISLATTPLNTRLRDHRLLNGDPSSSLVNLSAAWTPCVVGDC